MFGYLIQWAITAFFLMFAVRLTGPVRADRNTFGTAFATSALLAVVGFFVDRAEVGLLSLAWPVIWLWLLKSMYGIGWLRAFGVAIMLFTILIVTTLVLLVPMGLGMGLLAVIASIF
jgi:hypothetical protein